jgi:hypothetical protein
VPRVGSFRRAVALSVALVAVSAAALPTTAGATQRFRPRIGGAYGLMPPAGHQEVEIATGENYPVVYHGGSVMTDVTIHAVFWAPSGYQFENSPTPGVLSYEQLIQQWFTDVAHDSGTKTNIYSVLDEYGDGGGPGSYHINYDAATDTIADSDPYPAQADQCASPNGVATCVTDLEVQEELDKLITAHDPTGRGLHDLWFVFLPPNVDECSSQGVCGTTEYAGYHSLSNVGHGPVIYAVVPDPTIEFTPGPGTDPEGNPIAESTLDTIAHETFEAITNPEGNAWMDPNGFEAADKCENGPEDGTPLGYAADGSPYDQVINGHEYLVQMIWSNAAMGCLQRSAATPPAPAPATVDETQFSPLISGNIGTGQAGIAVRLALLRAGAVVSIGSTRTRAGGVWGPVRLSHAVGDDRDELNIGYGSGSPAPDIIQTGNGGNPFTEAGWTGWFDLDNGYAVGSRGVLLAPCGQTGVLTLTVGTVTTEPPSELCQTEADVAEMHTSTIHAGTRITLSSEDNRAVSILNPAGALVKLTVHLGEPGSVSALGNDQVLFDPTGFPSCTANLEAQTVSCTGLVPGSRYTLTRRRHDLVRRLKADGSGTVRLAGVGVAGGDLFTLVNSAHRTLTALHVAHLRVRIDGEQTLIASGRCQPGDYYGSPVTTPPIGDGIGQPGVSGNGTICPLDGRAKGLSASDIEQTDEFSGGLTRTAVPELESISPNSGATLYGPFVAQAQPALPGFNSSIYGARARVSLAVRPAGSGRRLVFIRNVASAHGVAVNSLPAGAYDATWVLRDFNGDTRTVLTRFVEAG